MESSPRELVGVHPTCLLKKTQSSFEEAHHWNIQANFYSVKDPHIAICMYDDLYGVQRYKMKYECGSHKRNSSVPLLSFYFYISLFSIFLVFFYHDTNVCLCY